MPPLGHQPYERNRVALSLAPADYDSTWKHISVALAPVMSRLRRIDETDATPRVDSHLEGGVEQFP